jgi:hypothetical protein
VIAAQDLSPQRLTGQRVVVLANVQRLEDSQVEALKRYVGDGGSLLIFPGDKVDVLWYNNRLGPGGAGLLPGALLSISGSLQEESKHVALAAQHYEHPALAWFNDPHNGSLSDGRVSVWFKLEEHTGKSDAGPGKPSTICRLGNGDPFLIEAKVGNGLVLEAAIPASADWSNLPARTFYVPLMQRLMIYAASTFDPPCNLEVGAPLAAFFPAALAGKTAVLTDPQGARHELPIVARRGHGEVFYADTLRAGGYLIEAPGQAPVHVVVSTPRSESDLHCLADAELAKLGKDLGATVVKTYEQYRDLEHTRRYGRELWPWFLWATIGLLFVELALQQYFARRHA